MAGIPLHTVLEHFRRLHPAGNEAERSDRELLHSFVTENNQEAFAMVLTRHAPLVWGVCRRILGHQQDAEDAFQATFLTLARRARSTRWRASVSNWLYTVAHRLAVRARQRRQQQRLREQEASQRPPTESSLHDLAAVDEELRRLPERYRELLLLHYLEGVTAEAAARQLRLRRGTFAASLGGSIGLTWRGWAVLTWDPRSACGGRSRGSGSRRHLLVLADSCQTGAGVLYRTAHP
jgi:RNA polymerase sigma factor (sigma-70 family)